MKRTVFILLCMIVSIISLGQEKTKTTNEIKEVTVSLPKFIGNEEFATTAKETQFSSLYDFIKKNVQYPEKAQVFHKEGTEIVSFVVTSTGKVTDFKINNSISPEVDEEVIRVLKTTNNMWKPATHNGIPVSQEQEISIAFMVDVPNGTDNTAEIYNHAKQFFAKGNNRLFTKQNSKTALKYYNRAICYLPNDKAILITRGLCKYELGDKPGACQDWNKIKSLGGFESNAYLKNFCEMEGYAEMLNILQEKK